MKTQFVQIMHQTQHYALEDQFQFRADRPHAWLQRLCIRILKKLGCYAHVSREVCTKRIDPDIQPIIDYLHRQRVSVIRMLDRYDEPLHILIGSSEWQEVCAQTDLHAQYFSYAGELRVGGGRFGRGQLIGMTVHVIPWMTGAIVVPTLEPQSLAAPNCRTCNDSGLIPAEHGIAQPCPMCDAYERRARVFHPFYPEDWRRPPGVGIDDEPRNPHLSISMTTSLTDDGVLQESDVLGERIRQIANIRAAQFDAAVREKLVQLGWTPPSELRGSTGPAGIDDDPTPPAYHALDDDADEPVGKILAAIIGILIALLIAMIAIWPQSARAQGFSENANAWEE